MRYVDFLDVAIPGAGQLGHIDFDYDLARVASLKTTDGKSMITHWLDPYSALSKVNTDTSTERVRDAASDTIYDQPTTGAVLPTRNTSLGGMPTLNISKGSLVGYHPTSPLGGIRINPNEWSVLSVFNTPAGNTDAMAFISKGDDEAIGVGKFWPNLRLIQVSGTDRMAIAEVGTNTPRIQTPAGLTLRGQTVVAIGTFSVDRGLSIYVNGVQITANANNKTPLTHTTVGFLGNTPVNGSSMPAFGSFGWQMVFNADLSRPEYTGAMLVLHEIIKRRYGIV